MLFFPSGCQPCQPGYAQYLKAVGTGKVLVPMPQNNPIQRIKAALMHVLWLGYLKGNRLVARLSLALFSFIVWAMQPAKVKSTLFVLRVPPSTTSKPQRCIYMAHRSTTPSWILCSLRSGSPVASHHATCVVPLLDTNTQTQTQSLSAAAASHRLGSGDSEVDDYDVDEGACRSYQAQTDHRRNPATTVVGLA